MGQVLILDLNIIRFGLENSDTQLSPFCQTIIEAVVSGEHKVAWSEEVIGLYSSLLSRAPSIFPNLHSGLMRAFYDAEKFEQIRDLIMFEEAIEAAILDRPDVPFVRLAATMDKGCILVTTDEPLRNSVSGLKLPEEYGFRISDPQTAVSQLLLDEPTAE